MSLFAKFEKYILVKDKDFSPDFKQDNFLMLRHNRSGSRGAHLKTPSYTCLGKNSLADEKDGGLHIFSMCLALKSERYLNGGT